MFRQGYYLVVMSLVAVIMSSLSSFLYNYKKAISLSICIAYSTASLFYSPLIIFLPLFAYDLFSEKSFPLKLAWLVPLVFAPINTDGLAFVFVAGNCIISALLSLRTGQLISVEEKYRTTHDRASEQSMLLKKENREIIERQDYEINIAMLNERNRIAREIHDNVGHLLTRSLMQVSASQVLHGDKDGVNEDLGQIKETLSGAMDSVRKSVHNLHDNSINLYFQLISLIEDYTFCKVNLKYDVKDENAISRELKYCFIAIVREALSNTARHSDATRINILLNEHPAIYQLIIKDNGSLNGEKDEASNGIGLLNMKDRVRFFNGVFKTAQDKGFKIFITVPKIKGKETV